MGEVDGDINVEQLKRLKQVFDEADEDGSGELDIDEFVEKIGPHLGENLSRTQTTQLFMKIDADAGGTVDWDEFTNYMFLQRSEADDDNVANWRFFPQDFKDKNDFGTSHRDLVECLYHFTYGDKYITCGRDGTFRLWNCADLRHYRTINNGAGWVTNCVYMPDSRKLVFTALDRSISFYDINRGSYDLVGRVYATGTMGVPMCMCTIEEMDSEFVVYGDTKGAVCMLLCGTRELPPRDLISTPDHRDFEILHNQHSDWVTQVTPVNEVGLVSSSLDSTIKVYDISRDRVLQTCTHHSKGVHSFVWCKAFSLFASAGVERDIIVWQGNTTRRMGELTGHTASVSKVAIDERNNHVISLSLDHVIKVWDLRNHKCLQTIMEEDWLKQEDAKARRLLYDSKYRRMVTTVNKPYVWPHKLISQDRTGHRDPVKGAIYNRTFHVTVSVDEGGTVCVWNMQNGSRESRFRAVTSERGRITALAFDKNERRLLTADNAGALKMWNFNNGSLLRKYTHSEDDLEIATVLFAADDKRESDMVFAAGWNCKIFVWEDDDEEEISEYRTYEGHREDILHMAVCPEKDLIATGDYEGRINVWTLHSGERRVALYHRADRYETSVERLLWVPHGEDCDGPLVLISCGGDGLIRVWHVCATPSLVCVFPGAQGRLEQVSAICGRGGHVAIGDTAGHLRVWNIQDGIDISSERACLDSFNEVSHWQGHGLPVSSVDVMKESGGDFLISASKDTNVKIWTWDGRLVGVLGQHDWDLGDRSSWQDPDGKEIQPPLTEAENLYLQAHKPGDSDSDDNEKDKTDSDVWQPEPADRVLQSRRESPIHHSTDQVHSMLRTHALTEISEDLSDVLTYTAKRNKQQAAVRGRRQKDRRETHFKEKKHTT